MPALRPFDILHSCSQRTFPNSPVLEYLFNHFHIRRAMLGRRLSRTMPSRFKSTSRDSESYEDLAGKTTARIGCEAVVQRGGGAIGDRDKKWREIEGRWKRKNGQRGEKGAGLYSRSGGEGAPCPMRES